MADKKISLKIAIDGEAEYRNIIQSINSENKTLNAQMRQLEAVFADNLNSYDALAKKGELLAKIQGELEKKTDTYRDLIAATTKSLREHKSETEGLKNAAEKATAVYKESEKQTKAYEKALEESEDALKQYESSVSKNADELEALKKAQESANKAYEESAKKTKELKTEMNSANSEYTRNLSNIKYCEEHQELYNRQLIDSETELIKLNREIDKNSGYLREAATSADGTAHSIDKYGKEVKDAAEDTKSFANAADLLAQAIVASGAIEGAEKLKDAIMATAKASVEYESAFAGVRKTVDGTAEELAEISDGIKQMATEIPLGTTALAGIAESAGQLGIARDDVLDFTRVMADLSVTTNLSSEEAATSLAKFANITKVSADEYSNLGSSIVALGNNFATTEADIVAMATRLASTGEVVGLTEPQILAVATALSSVGIEAEAGGSAFSKLLKTIATAVETGADEVEDFAKVAGMSAKEFSAAWRDDAVGAVAAFISGLGRLDSQGGSAIATLESLGLSEVRLSNAVLALASSEDILTKALDLSNTAWAENTALAEEAAIRYETTESKLQLLENSFNNLKITVGDELVGTFGGAIDGLTDLTQAADEFIKANPDVVTGLTAVASGIGGLAVAGTVTPLISTLFKTLTASPITSAIGLVLSLGSAFGTLAIQASSTIKSFEDQAKAAETLIEKGNELRDTFSEAYREIENEAESIETAISKVEQLGGKTDLTAQETVILQGAMNKLNSTIPGLKLSYDDLGTSLDATVIKLRLLAQISEKSAESAAIGTQIQELTEHRRELNDSIKETADDLKEARDYLEEISKGGIKTAENGAFDLIGTIQDNVNLAVNTMFGYVGDADKAVKGLEKNLENLKNQLGSTDLAIDDLTKNKADVDDYISDTSEEAQAALDSLKNAAERAEEAAQSTGNAVEETAKKTTAAAKTTKVTVDEAGQSIIDHAKTVQTNLDALTKEYDSAYKSAQSALGGIGGLFGELAFESDKSISDMLAGLDSQADFFTGYMLNIQRASQIGIDEGLVASLADGSKQSAGYLQVIVDEFNKVAAKYGENSEEAEAFVKDFNTKFEATSKAKDALAATMAGISTDFENRASDILGQADDLVTELSGYSGNAYDKVAEAVSETLTNIADGFTKFQIAAQEKSQGIIDAANYIKTGINTTLEVLPEEMRVAGQNVSLGLSEGILSKMGDVEKTVRRLAQEAILGAAKDELGIHSPSEEGREIGKFYDEGIAQGIERNQNTVISANLEMISNLEAASQSAAAAAGKSLGDTMAQAMSDALAAGQALRQAVESGSLTVDGKVVKTAESVGIPSLTGQTAADWNAEQKRDFGLPDDWSNQDIADWLNAGGAQSGGVSNETKANIENAIASESSGTNVLVTVSKLGNKGADGKTWGYGTTTKYNPNLSEQNIGKSRVQVTQNFYGTQSAYQVKKAAEKGVTNAVYK